MRSLLFIAVGLAASAAAAELDPATAMAIGDAETTMLASVESGIVVPSLQSLTPDAAAALVKAADGQPGLTITLDFAEAFAGFGNVMPFSGPVAPIDPEVARRLTALDGPDAVDVARALAEDAPAFARVESEVNGRAHEGDTGRSSNGRHDAAGLACTASHPPCRSRWMSGIPSRHVSTCFR